MSSHRGCARFHCERTQVVTEDRSDSSEEEERAWSGWQELVFSPGKPEHGSSADKFRDSGALLELPYSSYNRWQVIVYQDSKAVGRLVKPRIDVSSVCEPGSAGFVEGIQHLNLVYDHWQPVIVAEKKLSPEHQLLRIPLDAGFQKAKFSLQIIGNSSEGPAFAVPSDFSFSGSEATAALGQHLQRLEYIKQQRSKFVEKLTPSGSGVGQPLLWNQQQYTYERGDLYQQLQLIFDLREAEPCMQQVALRLAMVHNDEHRHRENGEASIEPPTSTLSCADKMAGSTGELTGPGMSASKRSPSTELAGSSSALYSNAGNATPGRGGVPSGCSAGGGGGGDPGAGDSSGEEGNKSDDEGGGRDGGDGGGGGGDGGPSGPPGRGHYLDLEGQKKKKKEEMKKKKNISEDSKQQQGGESDCGTETKTETTAETKAKTVALAAQEVDTIRAEAVDQGTTLASVSASDASSKADQDRPPSDAAANGKAPQVPVPQPHTPTKESPSAPQPHTPTKESPTARRNGKYMHPHAGEMSLSGQQRQNGKQAPVSPHNGKTQGYLGSRGHVSERHSHDHYPHDRYGSDCHTHEHHHANPLGEPHLRNGYTPNSHFRHESDERGSSEPNRHPGSVADLGPGTANFPSSHSNQQQQQHQRQQRWQPDPEMTYRQQDSSNPPSTSGPLDLPTIVQDAAEALPRDSSKDKQPPRNSAGVWDRSLLGGGGDSPRQAPGVSEQKAQGVSERASTSRGERNLSGGGERSHPVAGERHVSGGGERKLSAGGEGERSHPVAGERHVSGGGERKLSAEGEGERSHPVAGERHVSGGGERKLSAGGEGERSHPVAGERHVSGGGERMLSAGVERKLSAGEEGEERHPVAGERNLLAGGERTHPVPGEIPLPGIGEENLSVGGERSRPVAGERPLPEVGGGEKSDPVAGEKTLPVGGEGKLPADGERGHPEAGERPLPGVGEGKLSAGGEINLPVGGEKNLSAGAGGERGHPVGGERNLPGGGEMNVSASGERNLLGGAERNLSASGERNLPVGGERNLAGGFERPGGGAVPERILSGAGSRMSPRPSTHKRSSPPEPTGEAWNRNRDWDTVSEGEPPFHHPDPPGKPPLFGGHPGGGFQQCSQRGPNSPSAMSGRGPISGRGRGSHISSAGMGYPGGQNKGAWGKPVPGQYARPNSDLPMRPPSRGPSPAPSKESADMMPPPSQDPSATTDLERFLLQIKEMGSKSGGNKEQALQDLCLDDVWRFYLEPSIYGREVYTLGGSRGPSLCYFVPYLSAIQLFTPTTPRDVPTGEESRKLYVSDTEGWPRHMRLKFEFFEQEMPFNRTPLYEQVGDLADAAAAAYAAAYATATPSPPTDSKFAATHTPFPSSPSASRPQATSAAASASPPSSDSKTAARQTPSPSSHNTTQPNETPSSVSPSSPQAIPSASAAATGAASTKGTTAASRTTETTEAADPPEAVPSASSSGPQPTPRVDASCTCIPGSQCTACASAPSSVAPPTNESTPKSTAPTSTKQPFLRSAKIAELHPASWFAVAWYPVYRIPEAPLCARFLTFHSFAPLVISMQHAAAAIERGQQPPIAIMPLQVVGLQWYNMHGERWMEPLSDSHPGSGSSGATASGSHTPTSGPGDRASGGRRNVSNSRYAGYTPSYLQDVPWQAHLSELQATAERLSRGFGLRMLGPNGSENPRLRHPDYEFFSSRG
eukprot:gene15679-21784_t